MNITRQEVADAAMVSKAKVSKDCERGVLKEGSLLSIVSYIIGNRLRSGGIQAVTGLCPEGRGDTVIAVEDERVTKVRKSPADILSRPDFIPTHHDYESSDDTYINPND